MEHLPSKCAELSSSPRTCQKKKKKWGEMGKKGEILPLLMQEMEVKTLRIF
jgi:hypothetical protein